MNDYQKKSQNADFYDPCVNTVVLLNLFGRQMRFRTQAILISRVLAGLFFTLLPSAAVSAADCLKVSFAVQTALGKAQEQVYKRIYRQAGLCLTIVHLPVGRGDTYLKNGKVDGDAFDNAKRVSRLPYLTMVPTAVMVDRGVLLVHRDERNVPKSLNDLNGLVIGHKLGSNWEKQLIEGAGARPVGVNDRSQLFDMLDRGHIRVAIMRASHFLLYPKTRGHDEDEYRIALNLPEIKGFHVLRSEHKGLVPRLDRTIVKLQSTGQIPTTAEQWVAFAVALEGDESGKQ